MSKDALSVRFVVQTLLVALLAISFQGTTSAGEYKTPNFIIRGALSDEQAKHFGDTAEKLRRDLAILWLGEPLPQWSAPCPIRFKVGQMGAGGETSFIFTNDIPFQGEVFGWEMNIQGSAEALTTAVLPHEITHMIFASHFRCPLPRWLDEGGATSVENASERTNYRRQLFQFLRTERGIPFNEMVRMSNYPGDVMPLYAQGFSVVEYLIAKRGHRHFVDFIGDGLISENWGKTVQKHYGFQNLGELQTSWNQWVIVGCPAIEADTETALVADNSARNSAPADHETTTVQPVSYLEESPQLVSATPLPKVTQNTETPSVISPSQLSSSPFHASEATSRTSAHPGIKILNPPVSENRVLLEWKRL